MMKENLLMLDEPRDFDTLGGRIVRAREACSMKPSEFARHIGVKRATVQAWETDRSEPRANKLTMIAGILGVSPSWLLYGVGEAPTTERIDSELQVLRQQVTRIRELHDQTIAAIDHLETAIDRVVDRAAS